MTTYALTEGRHGRFLYNRNDVFIGKGLELYGEWSQAEVDLFAKIVRPGDVVLEAGANIGSHTIFLSRQVGESGRVVAIEPARLNFQLLCANVALNECFNVDTLQCAISDMRGQVPFPQVDPRATRNFGDLSIAEGRKAERADLVDVRSLDDLDLPRLDFVKADIEGFEPHLLRGGRNTLERSRPVLYLEIDAGQMPSGNRDELLGLLEPMGYGCYYYVAPMFNPDNSKGNPQSVYNEAVSLDLLCVPLDRAEVGGLTRARVGDSAIQISPGMVLLNLVPWEHTQFRYL